MANINEIEDLRHYFFPAAETVSKLPDKRSVPDWTTVMLNKSDGTKDLCVLINGQWYKVSTLTAIEGI